MPNLEKPHFVIAGGGITGLAAAIRLENLVKAHSLDQARITLLESSPRTGGKLLTERVGDFIIDAGPDIFMANKAGVNELTELLKVADRIRPTNPSLRKTYIRERDDFSLEPITMYDSEPLATMAGGIQELADAARAHLKQTEIVTSAHVERVSSNGPSDYTLALADNTTVLANAVILATPAGVTSKILAEIVPEADALLKGVSYTRTVTVSAGFREEDVRHPLDGYGYIVRNAVEGGVSACTWSSSKIPGRAPKGHVLLRVFIKGAGLQGPDIHHSVLDEFKNTLGITADPLFVRTYSWPEAVPVYAETHSKNIELLDATLAKFERLALAGSAIEASGIPDSITSGFHAAQIVWDETVSGFKRASRSTPAHSSSGNFASHFARK